MAFPLHSIGGFAKLCIGVGAAAVAAGTVGVAGEHLGPLISPALVGATLAGLLGSDVGKKVGEDAAKRPANCQCLELREEISKVWKKRVMGAALAGVPQLGVPFLGG